MTLTAAVEWKSEQSIVTMTMEMTIMKFGNEDDLLSRTGERGKVGEVLEPGDWDALLGVASCWSTTKGAHSIPAPTLCNMTATCHDCLASCRLALHFLEVLFAEHHNAADTPCCHHWAFVVHAKQVW